MISVLEFTRWHLPKFFMRQRIVSDSRHLRTNELKTYLAFKKVPGIYADAFSSAVLTTTLLESLSSKSRLVYLNLTERITCIFLFQSLFGWAQRWVIRRKKLLDWLTSSSVPFYVGSIRSFSRRIFESWKAFDSAVERDGSSTLKDIFTSSHYDISPLFEASAFKSKLHSSLI